mmetsp:Transcript_115364/g.235858  ORF Transcript_115364/g.235858 Transcript_115364/m.235858 type:complete len:336 (-) Transcript_115364:691-1698(-)
MRVLFLHFFFSCGICFAKDVLETSRIEENSKGRTNDSLSIFYEQLRRLETTAIDGCTESLGFPYRCYTTNAELGNAVIAPAIAIVVIRSGSASRKRQQHAPGNQQRREDTTTLAARTTLSKSCTGCPAFGLGCVRARSTRRTVPSGRTANELDSATIPLEWCAVWCGPLPFVVDTAETSMHRSVTRPFPIVVSSLVAGSDSRYPYPIDTATPIHLRGAKAPDQGVQRDSSYRGIHANHRNDLTTLRGKNLSIGGRQQRVLACRTATVRSVQRDRKGSIRPRVFETRVFESTVGAVADRRRSVAPDRVVVAAAAVAAATNSYVPVAIDHNPCLSQR